MRNTNIKNDIKSISCTHHLNIKSISNKSCKGHTLLNLFERFFIIFACPRDLSEPRLFDSAKWAKGETLIKAEQTLVDATIAEYRNHLSSVSWFIETLDTHLLNLIKTTSYIKINA